LSTLKPEITIDDLYKCDIRVGSVTKAETIPKSNKMLKLEVYFGPELGTKVIVATIAKSFDVDAILGVKVMAILNLPPRDIMGITSQGMLIAGHMTDTMIALASCNGVPDGGSIV